MINLFSASCTISKYSFSCLIPNQSDIFQISDAIAQSDWWMLCKSKVTGTCTWPINPGTVTFMLTPIIQMLHWCALNPSKSLHCRWADGLAVSWLGQEKCLLKTQRQGYQCIWPVIHNYFSYQYQLQCFSQSITHQLRLEIFLSLCLLNPLITILTLCPCQWNI